MTEQRIVLDTTVIISALLRDKSPPRWVVDTVLQDHVLLVSEDTFKELGSRLLRRKFDRYVGLDTRSVWTRESLSWITWRNWPSSSK